MHKWLTPEEFKGYSKGVAIAYLSREQDKGGDLDIKKAIHTLQLYLKLSEKDNKSVKTIKCNICHEHINIDDAKQKIGEDFVCSICIDNGAIK